MPTSQNHPDPGEPDFKYSRVRGERRSSQRERARRARVNTGSSSGAKRLVVRSKLRQQPDMRKIARAVIDLAQADERQFGDPEARS
ncbi:hypothetical protein GCM10027298_23270 [Epidermidibacterium keratini]